MMENDPLLGYTLMLQVTKVIMERLAYTGYSWRLPGLNDAPTFVGMSSPARPAGIEDILHPIQGR